jgi:predicted GNAT family N-acyltransferase
MGILIRTPETEKEWEEYYDLRFRVLREPLDQPRGSEKNDGDSSGIHFALFQEEELKAIARLDQSGENCAQVRFVAVETDAQGMGYGRLIMEATEESAKYLGNLKMILHARDYAVDFYIKLDYTLLEPSHKLFGVLQHFLMEKEL